jgi:hypothetical protein
MVATSRAGEEGKRTWAAGDFIALREEGESKLEKEAVWAEADKGKGAGRLPSKHCPVSGFTDSRLGFQKSKSGISLMTPQRPKPSLQRLPPMLRMPD